MQSPTGLPTSLTAITFPRVRASKELALELLKAEAEEHPEQAEELMSHHASISRVTTDGLKDYVLLTDQRLTQARDRVMATHDRADQIGRTAPYTLYGGLAGVVLSTAYLTGTSQIVGLAASAAPFVIGFVAQQLVEARAQRQWGPVDEARAELLDLQEAARKVNELYPDYLKVQQAQAQRMEVVELHEALRTQEDPELAFLADEITIGDVNLNRH